MPDDGKKNGFESKEIKYHSKSPEKLLEELKQKNQDKHSKYNKHRRLALIMIAISGMLIAGIALFFVIYNNNKSDNQPDYIRTVNPFVFKIVAETAYEYGHDNEIKVRVSNIENKAKSFTFEDFRFYIRSDQGEQVFTFNYPLEMNISMDQYDSRDVYDFRRENPDFTIKPGTYTIHSEFIVNKVDVKLTKQFEVFENVQTEISLYNDYALPGQEIPVYLTILNNSPEDRDFMLGSYRVFLEGDDSSEQGQQLDSVIVENRDAMGEYQVLKGEKLDIRLGQMKFPPDSGDYQLKATYFLNDDLNEYQSLIMVNNVTSTEGVRHLRILPYTMKVIGIDQKYKAEILIVNDDKRDVFERVKGFIFEIIRDNATLYRYTKYDEADLNIFIQAYSKKVIFDSTEWRDITFQESGTFDIKVKIILENGVLEYSEEILVEK